MVTIEGDEVSMLRRRIATVVLMLLVTLGVATTAAPAANATAQTCLRESLGYVCTYVSGSGTRVSTLSSIRGSIKEICNYSAWFFYVPPSGGAYSLGSRQRSGCVNGRAWFDVPVNRSFSRGTLVCTKFYENFWSDLIGEKCVGLS